MFKIWIINFNKLYSERYSYGWAMTSTKTIISLQYDKLISCPTTEWIYRWSNSLNWLVTDDNQTFIGMINDKRTNNRLFPEECSVFVKSFTMSSFEINSDRLNENYRWPCISSCKQSSEKSIYRWSKYQEDDQWYNYRWPYFSRELLTDR